MAKPAKKAVVKAPAKTTTKKKPVVLKAVTSVKAVAAKKAAPVLTNTEAVGVASQAKGFKLVAGVKLPPRVSTPGETAYPFGELEVGVAFFADSKIDTSPYSDEKEAAKAQREASATKANRINGAIRRYLKRNEGKKFTARTVINGTELGFDGDIGIVVQRLK